MVKTCATYIANTRGVCEEEIIFARRGCFTLIQVLHFDWDIGMSHTLKLNHCNIFVSITARFIVFGSQ